MPHKTNVFWITGLSGAGKSTLCRKLVEHLREKKRTVVMLDGDELREVMGAIHSHTQEERKELAMRYARLCKMIASQGVDVAIATISLFREVHEWNRANIPGYVEIYLDVPKEELIRRDPKQIYARAARDELKNVAGIDFAVDAPESPDVRVEWSAELTEDKAFAQIVAQLHLN